MTFFKHMAETQKNMITFISYDDMQFFYVKIVLSQFSLLLSPQGERGGGGKVFLCNGFRRRRYISNKDLR